MRLDGTRVRRSDTVVYRDGSGCEYEGIVVAVADDGLTLRLPTTERYLPAENLQEAVAEGRLRVEPAAGRVGEGEVQR